MHTNYKIVRLLE